MLAIPRAPGNCICEGASVRVEERHIAIWRNEPQAAFVSIYVGKGLEKMCRAEQNQATGRRKFRPLRRPMVEAMAERKSRDEKPLRPVWGSHNQRSWPLIRGGRVA
jgi:hypothetical protein